jgi:hypothetical protein
LTKTFNMRDQKSKNPAEARSGLVKGDEHEKERAV